VLCGLSHIAPDESLRQELLRLSAEEDGHANLLKRGKVYIMEMPDLAEKANMSVDEIEEGINRAALLIGDVENRRIGISQALKQTSSLESQYERVHFNAFVAIKDDSVKKMFETISREDENHSQRLKEILSKWSL
jgi:rubrerythrin